MLKSAYNKPYARIKMTMLSLFVVGILSGCGIRGGGWGRVFRHWYRRSRLSGRPL